MVSRFGCFPPFEFGTVSGFPLILWLSGQSLGLSGRTLGWTYCTEVQEISCAAPLVAQRPSPAAHLRMLWEEVGAQGSFSMVPVAWSVWLIPENQTSGGELHKALGSPVLFAPSCNHCGFFIGSFLPNHKMPEYRLAETAAQRGTVLPCRCDVEKWERVTAALNSYSQCQRSCKGTDVSHVTPSQIST